MKKILSLTLLGVGVLICAMEVKRKRRRLLEAGNNKVAKDFGGNVPKPLFVYLRSLGEGKEKGDYSFWRYQKVLEFSRSVSEGVNDDLTIILGTNKILTQELGRTVYLIYSKSGCPDTLTLVVHEETGELSYHSEVDFNVLP